MTVLAPAAWWQRLGRLTRSGSSVEGLSWALYDFANAAGLEPAIVPPGEVPT